MAEAPLLITREGAVTVLTFNRPQALNAIDVPMAQGFLEAIRQVGADSSARALLLRGNGKAFMAGGDLAVLQADPVQGVNDLIEPFHEGTRLLAELDIPVVAAVHGAAAGAGLSLMLQADFVLAAADARFNFAYTHIGTSCDGGASWSLPRWVGLRRALEIALLAEPLDAAAAERMGLINRTVSAGALAEESMALAQRLAAGPTVALGRLRHLMRDGLERNLPAQLQAEAEAFRHCAATADFRAGVASFFARRPADFKGD